MSAISIEPVSYSVETAAAATGYSTDVIRRAVRAGDLVMHYPMVRGRHLDKGSIAREELAAWITSGVTDRAERVP